MYSFYVLRHTSMANNNDTVTDRYLLGERADVLNALDGLEVDPRWTEECVLRVYERGEVVATLDLLPTVPDDEIDDDADPVTLDPAAVTVPALTGTVLPPGHPAVVDGEPLHYGCTSFYN